MSCIIFTPAIVAAGAVRVPAVMKKTLNCVKDFFHIHEN